MAKSKISNNIILSAIDSIATGETYPVVATIPWEEGAENDKLYIFQDTAELNPTFLIGSNEQLDINPRSKSFTIEAVKVGVSTGKKTYAGLNITQEKATYEYTLEISVKTGEKVIPASGGSVELRGILTTWRNGRKVSTLETPFTMGGYAPGFTVSGNTVTASNMGTVIGPSRAINIIGYTNNTIDGSTISGSITIIQQENKVTKVSPFLSFHYNPSEIPTKGGASTPVISSITYVTKFSSGEVLGDLPTSKYIENITKTNIFKIHTSNSPFSINESTGVVTVGTRGNTPGDQLVETVYLTHRIKISYKDDIFVDTNASVTRTTPVTQQANQITYSDINISLFGVADIPASGGQVSSGNVSYSQVASYTSGEFETITTGAVVTFGEAVIANSKNTTISNTTIAGTLEVTVTLNGKSATKTANVYQQENKVTNIELLNSWTHEYSEQGTAAEDYVSPDSPSRTYEVRYSFLSGATSTDDPASDFGSLSDSIEYTWPGPGSTFTELSASGTVTMESLGTTITNSLTSPLVTRTDKVTWTPSSDYAYKTLQSNEHQQQAEVTREGNYVEEIQLPESVLSLSYDPSEISAKGGTSNPTLVQSQEPTLIYTSGSQGAAGDIPSSTYGRLITTTNYELGTINSQYAQWSINSSTGVITVTSNGTNIANQGSAESIYRKTFEWAPSEAYNGGGAETIRYATATVYQQANTVVSEILHISSFVYSEDIPVSGGSVSPSLGLFIEQKFTTNDIGIINPSSFTDNYAFVGTPPATFSINADTGVVSATEVEGVSELKADVRVDVSYPTWDNSGTLTTYAQTGVVQPAGMVIYDTPVIAISYPQVPASGGTVSPIVQVTQAWGWNDDYDGGVNAFNLSTLPAGSYTFTNTASSTNGQVTLASKGTTLSDVTVGKTVTIAITLNGKSASKQANVTQEANQRDINSIRLEPYAVDPTWVSPDNWDSIPASGGYISFKRYANYTYTSTVTLEEQDGAPGDRTDIVLYEGGSFISPHGNGGYHVLSRGTVVGVKRKGTIYWQYGGFTSNYLTLYQNENLVTKLEAVVNNPATSTVHFYYTGNPIPAAGGTATVIGNGKATLTFSSGSVTSSSINGDNRFGGTLSFGRTYTMATGNGFSINTSTGAVTIGGRGTTIGEAITSPDITSTLGVTFTYPSSMDKPSIFSSLSGTQTVQQQANAIISYGAPTGGTLTVADIPASGGTLSSGTLSGTVSQSRTYTSGSTDTYTANIPLSGNYNSVTADNLGTTITSRTKKGTLIYTYQLNNKTGTKSADVYQQANSINWNPPVISISYGDVPASGGTVNPSLSITQSGTYTSGSPASNTTISSKSFSGTSVNTSTGAVSASNLGKTVKARTKITTASVSVTANGKTSTKSTDVYQAQNRLLNGDLNGSNSAFKATCELLANQLTAAGGSATFGGSASHTHTYYTQYDSGTYGPYTKTVSDGISLSMVGNGNSRFKFSSSVATHSSMTTNVTTDTVTIRCTNSANTSTYHEVSASVSNTKITQYNTNTGSQYYECSGTTSVYYQDYITYGEYDAGTFQIGTGRTEVSRSQVDGQCGYVSNVTVHLSISLNASGGSGSITADRAVNDDLEISWYQTDGLGNGSDSFVTMSIGQSSVSISSIDPSWPNYEIMQVNTAQSPPWVSGKWSYYW